MEVAEHIAYLTTPEGVKVQVLNEDGTDWDDQATKELYNQLASK